MSKKLKQPDVPQRPEDCHTIEQRLAYSRMLRQRWEDLDPNAPPSAILDTERFPIEDPTKPWTSSEYANYDARVQEERQRAHKRENKRKTNRLLYRASKQGD